MDMLRKMSHEKIVAFKAWLTQHGASVMVPTNEWELVRWTGDRGVCVIYFNKKGYMTMRGEALEAFKAFKDGTPYRVSEATKLKRKVSPIIRALRARDGDLCFYCHQVVWADDSESVEHLVSRTHGGPNHMSNYVLAHAQCNHRAGHLSVMDKVRLREKNRKALQRNVKGGEHGNSVEEGFPHFTPSDGGA